MTFKISNTKAIWNGSSVVRDHTGAVFILDYGSQWLRELHDQEKIDASKSWDK